MEEIAIQTDKKQDKTLSRIQGSLIAGAAGDALGYEVEFLSDEAIQRRYGPQGITKYKLYDGKALFSDDTQMTLFTANGLLYGETRTRMLKTDEDPHVFIPAAYADWLYTQDHSCRPARFHSWIAGIPELNKRRAPGNTCLSALMSGETGTIGKPINDSCGCGGVMRVAPVGLFYGRGYDDITPENIILYGALAAACTHGHPMGYIPAGLMSLIVFRMAFTDEPVRELIFDSLDETGKLFRENPYWRSFQALINQAADCSMNTESDRENIRRLGEGWIGNEALAIAVYAVLRYEKDLGKALIAAVNHDGDSDSTGAITGNILGARVGMEGITADWMDDLELKDTILEMGTDLWAHCPAESELRSEKSDWNRKYVQICGLNQEMR